MINIKRNAKNIVKKYSYTQIKVREATSNDPWGPSSTIMAEISDLTYNVVAFSEIMALIWKRLNDHGKNWRHVYKALVLLEYLIKTGSEKVASQCTENIFAIQTLKDFQYMEENKDIGMNIRERSKKIVALLKDCEKLKNERAKAMKAKSRRAETMSSISKNNNIVPVASVSGVPPTVDIDLARPQSLTEEETQFKLALALSQEEAEKQESTRKNDELRLKLALDVSKKLASSSLISDEPSTSSISVSNTQSTSNLQPETNMHATVTSTKTKYDIDDLIGLTLTDTEPQNDPWTVFDQRKSNRISKNPFEDL